MPPSVTALNAVSPASRVVTSRPAQITTVLQLATSLRATLLLKEKASLVGFKTMTQSKRSHYSYAATLRAVLFVSARRGARLLHTDVNTWPASLSHTQLESNIFQREENHTIAKT